MRDLLEELRAAKAEVVIKQAEAERAQAVWASARDQHAKAVEAVSAVLAAIHAATEP